MIFNETIKSTKMPENGQVIYREAVRAVVFNTNHQND